MHAAAPGCHRAAQVMAVPAGSQMIRSSQVQMEDGGAPMPCSGWLQSMSRPPGKSCPSLAAKKITPHTLRHGAAMAMLRRGVDLCALLFGWVMNRWKQPRSTSTPICNSSRKHWRTPPSGAVPDRFRPTDSLLALLRVCDYAAFHNHAHQRSFQIGASANLRAA